MRVESVDDRGRESPAAPSLRVQLPGHRLERIRLERRPAVAAHVILQDAASGRRSLLPPAVRRRLLGAMGQRGRAAYHVFAQPAGTFVPSVAVPDVGDDDTEWLSTAREQLTEGDPAIVSVELARAFPAVPAAWARIADNAATWLRDLGDGLAGAGPLIGQLWQRARTRLDVEQARLDTAAGSPLLVRSLVNTLSRRLTMTATELWMHWRREIFIEFPGELRLAPLLAVGPTGLLIDRGPDICAGYSLQGASALWSARTPPERDRATKLLGATRAKILLATAAPVPMGTLARDLDLAPSTVTYHVDRLRAAGLVSTTRVGPTVWVSRTADGHAIVDLLG